MRTNHPIHRVLIKKGYTRGEISGITNTYMKTAWIVLGSIVVIALGAWWYMSMGTPVPTPTTQEQGQVQGAVESDIYEDNSKDGAPDSSVQVETQQ